MGLYFKTSIVFYYFSITVVYIILKKIYKKDKKFYILNPRRFFKYIKLLVNRKTLILIILSSIISNSIVLFQNNKYDSLYRNLEELEGEAVVISSKEEKEYMNSYKIKVISINKKSIYKDTNLYLKINKNKYNNLEYGDKVKIKGKFIEPELSRNYRGFNYKEYLKTLKIYGSIKASKIEVIEKNKGNIFFRISNAVFSKIKYNLDLLFKDEVSGVIKGILLGDKSDIDENIQENFRTSGISHILAVSGMHVSYIIIIINILFLNKVGKKNTKFIIMVFLILYMFLTRFSPSIVRAGLMEIILLSASFFYRKNDVATSMSLSLLSILIYNPFLLENIGLQFSYIATIGIILLQKNTKKIIKNIRIKNKKWKHKIKIKHLKIISKIQDVLSVTISAQIVILPIMIYHFNVFGTYFLLTNLTISLIIVPILFLSIMIIIFSFNFNLIAIIISYLLSFLIHILICISNISFIPFSKIYLPTPNILIIIIYYILLCIFNILYFFYNYKKQNTTIIRFRNLVALIKYKIFLQKKRFLIFISLIFLVFVLFKLVPKDLKINFVDVGQGDCTFIVTPYGKTILVDGGGSESKDYDVGKNTVLPYLLDRGFTKIDYIIISHFDQDHVRSDCLLLWKS